MALIGYAEADFYSMRTKGHYFVDRTSFIAEQETNLNRSHGQITKALYELGKNGFLI